MSVSHFLAPAFVVLCVLLGGASAAGYAANALLQLIAIPFIYWAIMARRNVPLSHPAKWLLGLLIALLGIFAVQLIPLPPALWTALPGRGPVLEGFEQLGLAAPWLTLSLSPQNTLFSLLWLLPAIAALLLVVRLGFFKPRALAWTVVGVTVLSVAIGATQIAGGERAASYFYAVTNRGLAVGFFANSNHMATLLLVAIPFLAALAAGALRKQGRSRRKTASGLVVLAASIAAVLAIGLAINGSLAGVGLAIPTIGASLLLLRGEKPAPRWALPAIIAIALGMASAVLLAPMGNNLIGAESQNASSRRTSFAITGAAAMEYFPAGSGIGTFQAVYRMHENPATVTTTYMNHAHGDLLEVLLETGLFGLILLVAFLIWWGGRVRNIWKAGEDSDLFARAATIASGAIMIHSLVDYPLRTAAISVLFAVCLALMAEPRPKARRSKDAEEQAGGRHLSAD